MPKAASRGSGSASPPEPVLRKIRIPLIQRARLTHAGASEDVFVIDVGLLGVFVERAASLPVGDLVELQFLLPGNAIPVDARCRVAWWNAQGGELVHKALPGGLGLEFVELTEGDRSRLREHLLEYLQRHPGIRRFHRQRTEQDGDEDFV